MKPLIPSLALVSASVATVFGSALFAGDDIITPPPPHVPPPGGHEIVPGEPTFIPPILTISQNPVFEPGTGAVSALSVSQDVTNGVSQSLREIVDFCSGISSDEYRVDCLGDRLGAVAAELPATGDYAEVRAALEDASRDLTQLARENASTTLPQGIARQASDPTVSSTRPLIPVETATLPDVNVQATAILDELESRLLRSVANSDERRSHYEQIAVAVDFNKVLLRSS